MNALLTAVPHHALQSDDVTNIVLSCRFKTKSITNHLHILGIEKPPVVTVAVGVPAYWTAQSR